MVRLHHLIAVHASLSQARVAVQKVLRRWPELAVRTCPRLREGDRGSERERGTYRARESVRERFARERGAREAGRESALLFRAKPSLPVRGLAAAAWCGGTLQHPSTLVCNVLGALSALYNLTMTCPGRAGLPGQPGRGRGGGGGAGGVGGGGGGGGVAGRGLVGGLTFLCGALRRVLTGGTRCLAFQGYRARADVGARGRAPRGPARDCPVRCDAFGVFCNTLFSATLSQRRHWRFPFKLPEKVAIISKHPRQKLAVGWCVGVREYG
jgi:hypothetical protein